MLYFDAKFAKQKKKLQSESTTAGVSYVGHIFRFVSFFVNFQGRTLQRVRYFCRVYIILTTNLCNITHVATTEELATIDGRFVFLYVLTRRDSGVLGSVRTGTTHVVHGVRRFSYRVLFRGVSDTVDRRRSCGSRENVRCRATPCTHTIFTF